MSEIKVLSIIDGKKPLSLEVEPPKFIVSRFFPTGLHILAGSPKISIIGAIPWLCQFDEWICFKQTHSFF